MASNLRVDQILPSTSTNVAIGTATGSVTLVGSVSGTSITNSGTTTVAAGSTSAPSISPSGDSNTGIFFPSADTIAFAEGGAEALRIDSSGNAGIGSAIPTQKLDVNGTIRSYSGTNAGTFKDNQLRSDSSGTFYFDHGTVGQSFQFRTSTSSSLDTTGPSITSAGNIAFASGKGIDFSATANSSGTMTSELLADYEEGTFTPTDGSGAGLTFGANTKGHYVRMGNVVHVFVRVVYPSTANGSNAVVSGLPFAGFNPSGADVSNGSVPSGFGYISGGSVIPQIHMSGGSADTNFYSFGTPRTNANFSGLELRFGITYRTS